MTRSATRSRLAVECFERRDNPSTFGWAVNLSDAVLSHELVEHGSISFANGTVTATGTGSSDIIRVEPYTPVFSPFAFSFQNDNALFGDQIVVTITDTAGNTRTDQAGNPLRQFFDASAVQIVQANALGGHDRTINTSSAVMIHSGGEGNDTMSGGSNMDILNGGNGDDSLSGGDGNDQLYGLAGKDRLFGEGGNDLMQSGDENDRLDGGFGNDKMDGEGGDDSFFGGYGDDTMSGGDGRDLMLGQQGNDLIHGDAGNDIISGGDGNDMLFGDANNDDVQGGLGNDALFGGAGREYLAGGGGADRFLKWNSTGNSTTIADAKSIDAVTTFKDTTSTVTFSVQGHKLRYNPKSWTEAEIVQVDAGLSFMHNEVGNTKLLKRSNGSNVTMLRFGNYIAYIENDGNNDANDLKANQLGVSFAGFNKGDGQIFFNDLTFNGSAQDVASTVIHELAHNWDKENGRFDEWKRLSGWVESTKPNATQTLSKDGKWVYNTNAEFVRDYGKTNPLEDFSTTFEAYFALKTGQLSYGELVRLQDKLNFIGLFISRTAS